ncbi:hypothetical protein [Lewinella sp. IMCC34183]|uniref:hypothetical protein n=1 Tax=Lewinella sp. IMCC34183 TaxID=2248762 RepID=UPI000E24BE43|nr:hypothetical protein [Lewinella sp. IMCC34183]
MRTLLLSLFVVFVLSACSEEQQALNRIAGTFETTAFVVTAPATDSVLFRASPTFQFAECDLRDNRNGQRCPVTIVDANGTVYDYQYGIETTRTGPDYIVFRPLTEETWEIDTDLNRSIHTRFVFELDKEVLKMYTNEFALSRDSIAGYREYDVSITAVKR